MTTQEKGQTLHRYWSSACPGCHLKARCTSGKQRRVTRWEHEAVLDRVQARLDREPEKMRLRRQTVEHPFGTIKSWMGYTHFLTKTLPNGRTETSPHVLADNLERVMNILGTGPPLEALRAWEGPFPPHGPVDGFQRFLRPMPPLSRHIKRDKEESPTALIGTARTVHVG